MTTLLPESDILGPEKSSPWSGFEEEVEAELEGSTQPPWPDLSVNVIPPNQEARSSPTTCPPDIPAPLPPETFVATTPATNQDQTAMLLSFMSSQKLDMASFQSSLQGSVSSRVPDALAKQNVSI